MEPIPCGVGQWSVAGLGNHRAVVRVSKPGPAVRVRLPWRRRDRDPERKEILVYDAATGVRVTNVFRVAVTREYGELVFEPVTMPGDYFLYYLPQVQDGWQHSPITRYLAPESTADPQWLAAVGLDPGRPVIEADDRFPQAEVVELQAVSEFHRMDPMEVPATAEETAVLLARYEGRPYLVFPEDRRYPIRMRDELPCRWLEVGPTGRFHGTACQGEFYAFQLGVLALGAPVTGLGVAFEELRDEHDHRISADAMRCINTEGVDWLGQPLRFALTVPPGTVQPLWCGVQVPADAPAGEYRGTLTLRTASADTSVEVVLQVTDQVLADAGDNDLWRQARLRWLDSERGTDEQTAAPYPPIAVQGRALGLLGREVHLGELGLPDQLLTRFDASVQTTDAQPEELLAGPMRVVATAEGGTDLALTPGGLKLTANAPGAAHWEAKGHGPGLDYTCQANLESDGYLTCRVVLRARAALDLSDVRLEIPIRPTFAEYLMGMGYHGGRRQGDWHWTWAEDRANHMIWLGAVHGGVQLKLMYEDDVWELYALSGHGLPPSWHNEGRGGCRVSERPDGSVELVAFTGARSLAAGEELSLRFGLLLTPFHPLSPEHWNWRYYSDGQETLKPLSEVAAAGVRVRHLHHANALNPHINYPFVRADELTAYAAEAHALGVQLVIYYTVRELSNYAAELWAWRSLGDEIFRRDQGFRLADQGTAEPDRPAGLQGRGGSWLWEHLRDDFLPAWHHPLGDGVQDAAIATQGLSRLHNYYVEGLNWLVRHAGIDGIYLDGIGYDRQIMKRVRKVLQRARPDTLVTFHSGNNFDPRYGLNSPAVQYLEHLPYCDSIWFGEGYDYDSAPDYWLVEISGIPFGVAGEMLDHGGNPWRGMLYYGMASRLGWNPQSRPESLWRFWDESRIAATRMVGYWDPRCPVRTGQDEVLATAYLEEGRAVVALASWASEEKTCTLELDWSALGLDPERVVLRAPAIEGYQAEARFAPDEPIPVAPGRGWLLLLAEA